MTVDYWKMITDKEEEFGPLFARMDEDRDLLAQKDYFLFDKDNRDNPDVENLTLNDAAVFSNFVTSTLTKTNPFITVEGHNLKDDITSKYENFFKGFFILVDMDLIKRGFPPLYTWNIRQICGRGRIVTRVVLRENEKTGKFEHGIYHLDSRYVTYEVGINDYKWIASKHSRTRNQIEDEYGPEIAEKLNISGRTRITLTDLWIEDKEMIFLEKELIKTVKHVEPELPFVICMAPVGTGFQDGDQIENEGESIFWLNRKLYKAKNKMASLLDTLNMYSIFAGLQKEVENENLASRPAGTPYGKRFVVPVQKGTKGYFSMPVNDIKAATQLLYSILDSDLQDGALPKVSYGVTVGQNSGVAIAQLKETEDKVFKPRIKGLETYHEQLYQMILNQFKAKKLKAKLGTPGFITEYSYTDFEKPVTIKCLIEIISPTLNMANISMAAAVGNLITDDTKMRKYLQLDNPDEETRKKLMEKAIATIPHLELYDMVLAFHEEGNDIKAQIVAASLGLSLKQILTGELEQPESPTVKPVPSNSNPPSQLPGFGGIRGMPQKINLPTGQSLSMPAMPEVGVTAGGS